MSANFPEDQYFLKLTKDELWQRYCGFLDLSVEEFMDIQYDLLLEEIDLVYSSFLGKKLFNSIRPTTVDEFRKITPLTTYNDYEPYLSNKNEEVLAFKPEFWCHSSGRGGYFKWLPQTMDFYIKGVRASIASAILASSTGKGQINIAPGWRFFNVSPPKPYGPGYMLDYLQHNMSIRVFPNPDETVHLPLEERFDLGFKQAYKEGLDIIGAMPSILSRMGETIGEQSIIKHFSKLSPNIRVFYRFLTALYKSHKEKRNILPKDLWPTKAIIAYGMDGDATKNSILKYWGVEPFTIYGCAEGMVLAMQSWARQHMTFLPNLVFLEFIPYSNTGTPIQDEKNPYGTVLLNELMEGGLYEPVITQSRGMPLLRYRMQDLIRVESLSDPSTGIKLPQISFIRRVDETINLDGLTQLDEKTILQAIAKSGIDCESWISIKDTQGGKSLLHIYLEPKNINNPFEIEKQIDQQLQIVDNGNNNNGVYRNRYPIKVTMLEKGTFTNYTKMKGDENANIAHLKPKRINPSNESLRTIINISERLKKENNVSAE